MSDSRAIATVTAALTRLLGPAASGAVSGAHVRTARPDGTGSVTPPTQGVNVYLYRATPSAAWRNDDLPTRRADGTVLQRPRCALDLNYLLTFHGDDAALEPQRLLGAVVSTLHAQPLLTRDDIVATVTPPPPPQSGDFPYLAGADLADSIDLVRFTPLNLSLDEMSQLWSVLFQVHYSLCVAYQASVVLIESPVTPQPALPVRARNVYAVTFRQPTIEGVSVKDGPGQPIVAGSTLRISGRNLRGDTTKVQIGSAVVQPAPADVTDTTIDLALATPPLPVGTARAGVTIAQVLHPAAMGTPSVEHRGFESNVAAFVLQPTIAAPHMAAGKLVLGVSPPLASTQKVTLLLNEQVTDSPASYSLPVTGFAADATSLGIDVPGVGAGAYFVRLQVDGAESPLDLDTASPTFGPSVTIP